MTVTGTAPGSAGAYDGVPLVFEVAIAPEFTLTASADAVGRDCLSTIGLVLESLGDYTGPVTVTGTDASGLHRFGQVVNVTGPGQYPLSDSTSAGRACTTARSSQGGLTSLSSISPRPYSPRRSTSGRAPRR